MMKIISLAVSLVKWRKNLVCAQFIFERVEDMKKRKKIERERDRDTNEHGKWISDPL